MRRIIKWFVVLLVIVGVVAAISIPTATWVQERNAPKFLTATVSRGRVEMVVNSTGTIKPVRTVAVGAFTNGPIKEINIDFNSEITRIGEEEWLVVPAPPRYPDGKVKWLALIDDKLQSAAVERDKAAVASQQADLTRITVQRKLAFSKWKAGDMLAEKKMGFISVLDLEELKSNVDVLDAQIELAKASIRQAQANLRNSEDQLRYTKILPPEEIDAKKGIKGKVIDRKVDPGQTVVGNFQVADMFTIALEMDKHVHVYGSVDEADIGELRTASERKRGVTFTVDSHPGKLFEGTIHDIRLNSTTTQNVVTYPVIIDAPNKDQKLKPGMTASITFQIDAKDDVVRVPVSALRYTPLKEHAHPDDRHYLEAITSGQAAGGARRTASEKVGMAQSRHQRIVWIQDGKLLRAVPVTLGLIENRYAELIRGDLTDGQVVVTGVEGNMLPK